jgi:hypothetical protein
MKKKIENIENCLTGVLSNMILELSNKAQSKEIIV